METLIPKKKQKNTSYNFVLQRLFELANGNNSIDDITEIIGSERSLERILLKEDIKKYVQKGISDGILEIKNSKVLGTEKLAECSHSNEKKNGITRVIWDITRKCNLSCNHCYAFKNENLSNSNELSYDEIQNVLNELRSMYPYMIVFGGGEPFLREDFIKILDATKKAGDFRIKVLSNGILFNNTLVKTIKDKVDFIQFSLDGKKENHLKLRNDNESFEKVINAIKLSKKVGIQCGICMTLNKHNINDIDWIVNFSLEHNLYKIRISPFVAAGKALKNYRDWSIPADMYKITYEKLFEYKIKYNGQLLFDFRDELYGKSFETTFLTKKRDVHENYLMCAAGRSIFYINPEGDVSPCNFLDNDEYHAGNVKHTSISEIWENNKMFNNLRKINVNDINKCKTCKRKNLCGGGLRCNAAMIHGSFYEADDFCHFYE